MSRTDRGWFGHSAGGLFGVYVLLNDEQRLFSRFLLCESCDRLLHPVFGP